MGLASLLLDPKLNNATHGESGHLIDLAKNSSRQLLDHFVYQKHIPTIAFIEALAVAGVIVWLAGYRFIKPVMFLAGFLLAFMVFYVFSPTIFDSNVCCGAHGKEWVHVLLSCLVGTLGGYIGCRVYYFGVFTIGECLGLVFALAVLNTPLYVYFTNNLAYGCFMAATSIAFGTLATFFEKPVVISSTSFSGSFAWLYGVDYFIKTSFSVIMESFLLRIRDVVFAEFKEQTSNWSYRPSLPHRKALKFNKESIPLFAIWAIMTVAGIVIQYKITSKGLKSGSSLCQYLNCFNCCKSSDD